MERNYGNDNKFHKIMRKARHNMPLVHMVNKLDKDILNSGSKYIIENDKFIIEDINIISNNIKESVIRNKYNKVYKI